MLGKYKKRINAAKEVKALQEKNIDDDYMVGLYNGMELILSIMEDRKPDFKDCIKEPEVLEGKEEKPKRTAFSGVRRRGANSGL